MPLGTQFAVEHTEGETELVGEPVVEGIADGWSDGRADALGMLDGEP